MFVYKYAYVDDLVWYIVGMRFYDTVVIRIVSGKWGDGLVSAKKEAGHAMGGPSGGNGGKWGDVIFVASKDKNTLVDFRQKNVYKADSGEPGRAKEQYGANASPIILTVPVGTVIKDADTGRALFQFFKDKEEYIAARWGSGWVGNMHFKNAISQYPNFALYGEPGQKKELELELQLLGDVGLVGTPSVGKSTLINAVSNVKAKTAEYHFTTLVPNLGSVTVDGYSFNMVDIPGLIQGASQWKGLGNDFLKHVLKSQVFCLIADMTRYEQGVQELLQIMDEILLYMQDRFSYSQELGISIEEISTKLIVTESNNLKLQVWGEDMTGEQHLLFEKALLFVMSKVDLVADEEIVEELRSYFIEHVREYCIEKFAVTLDDSLIKSHVFVLSSANRQGLDPWLHAVAGILQHEEISHLSLLEETHIEKVVHKVISDITDQEKQFLLDKEYLNPGTSKHVRVWEIDSPDFCRLAFQVPWGNDEAQLWFWKVVSREGFLKIFNKHNVYPGDVLKIVSHYHGLDDRYIMYSP